MAAAVVRGAHLARAALLAALAAVPAALGAAIKHETFLWPGRPGLQLHYTHAQPAPRADGRSGARPSPLVCLPGFGVGTFQWGAQLEALGDTRPTYAIDWLGQGESWPLDETHEAGLRYDADLWTDQLETFLEHRLGGGPAILCGNSLGGYVAVQLALRRSELVAGLALLNPTPIWSFAAPARDAGAWRPFGWDATLPAPPAPFAIGSRWFDTLRNPRTISAMLSGVYADRRAVDALHARDHIDAAGGADTLPGEIARAAARRGGHAAFTSILFSPRTEVSFEEALEVVFARDEAPPVALIYGVQDPWVVPLWGDRAARRVASARARADPEAWERTLAHYHVEPAGHCPHHEAPGVVNDLLACWAAAVDAGHGAQGLPETLEADEVHGRRVRAARADGRPRGLVELLAAALDPVRMPARASDVPEAPPAL